MWAYKANLGTLLKYYYQWNQSTTAIRLFEGFVAAERNGAGNVYRSDAANILLKFFRHEQYRNYRSCIWTSTC